MQKAIGIIGSGMIGKQVAKLALDAGYKVAICNSRSPETLAEFVTSLKGDIRALNLESMANFTDMLVVAIPFEAYTKLPTKLLAGKIVELLPAKRRRDAGGANGRHHDKRARAAPFGKFSRRARFE
ncbi:MULTISPECIES: NAD(P)-binding domain-containing protein [Campylobacter]|jgi:NADP oxidoreductase, coenzyme f420-dependent|uniref:NAD(P)-binding domain-containing protein n=1 Tax=Campylobacter TaxID=194 RepID=UPI00027A39F1|nr:MULTISPECIES: NAD(P)-binding domain-containing protein [Campylobacter]EJP74258.1 NADP oxidoreductase coenzyme F420-dependent [Campylobacter sp. FOBRC14]